MAFMERIKRESVNRKTDLNIWPKMYMWQLRNRDYESKFMSCGEQNEKLCLIEIWKEDNWDNRAVLEEKNHRIFRIKQSHKFSHRKENHT
jgi:hypothetical protein